MHDVAGQLGRRGSGGNDVDRIHLVGCGHDACRIQRVRFATEADIAGVGLCLPIEEPQDPCGLPQAEQQNAGGIGVKGSRMTNLTRLENTSRLCNDIVRCPAAGFVHDNEARRAGVPAFATHRLLLFGGCRVSGTITLTDQEVLDPIRFPQLCIGLK